MIRNVLILIALSLGLVGLTGCSSSDQESDSGPPVQELDMGNQNESESGNE